MGHAHALNSTATIRGLLWTSAGLSLDKLQAAMQEAATRLPLEGWPVPPAVAMQQVVALASRGGAKAAFTIGDLVR